MRRRRLIILRLISHGVISSIFFLSSPCRVEAQSGGGFFDKDFAKQGFFTEESSSPPVSSTASSSSPTVAPAKTPAETSAVAASAAPDPVLKKQEIVNQILGGTRDIIDQTRGVSTNPNQQKDMNSALQGVRELLHQNVRGISPKEAPRVPSVGELTVINTPEEYEKEISLGRIPTRPQISVVISASPRATFLKTLDKLLNVATKKHARLKSVYIIGMNRDSLNMGAIEERDLQNIANILQQEGLKKDEIEQFISTSLESVPTSHILLDKLGFVQTTRFGDGAALLTEKKITISPTWIVEDATETKLFEGAYDPSEFLDDQGYLATELPDDTRNGSQFGKLKGEDAVLIQYDIANEDLEKQQEDIRQLKDCTRARTRRFLVGPASLGVLNFFDILIYKPEHLDRYPEIASYSRGKLEVNPELPLEELLRKEPILSFIQTLPIRCLPTRFRQINDGPKQYLEFLQGEASTQSQ